MIEPKFENFYYCEKCDKEFEQDWSTICTSKCPICHQELEPYKWEFYSDEC